MEPENSLKMLWDWQNTLFDLPEADKCLLASGELDVQLSMFDGH